MKFFKLFLPIFMLITIISGVFQPVIESSESISSKVFRLHIIANSDSTYDQNVKLQLRDFILDNTSDLFSADNIEDNIAIAKNNIDNLTSSCNEYLRSIKSDYEVKITVIKEFFKTRVYDDFTLPAGMYNSLKIEIGQGKGHNWWCIVFPAVCISACSSSMSDYLTEEEMSVIEGGYTAKFKVIELYETMKNKIK